MKKTKCKYIIEEIKENIPMLEEYILNLNEKR